MKKYEFIGMLVEYERLNGSVNGNPAYCGTFASAAGDTLTGRTASDASCAYEFLNYTDCPRKVTYHYTKNENVIFDYIEVLKGGINNENLC